MMTGAAARFSGAVAQLSGGDWSKLGLAVSGGPDSIALMLLAHAAFPGKIHVACVDHGLRPESKDEVAHVQRLCDERGIPFTALKPAQPITGSVQSEARKARYLLLQQWAQTQAIDWIATAHHADDQLETLVMRLARGAGVSGMAGIRPRNHNVIRPLLDFTKDELIALCHAAGVTFAEDPSNNNSDFDRVAARIWLKNNPQFLDSKRAVRTASALSQANDALQWAADKLIEERLLIRASDHVEVNAEGLPLELKRRLLIGALLNLDPQITVRGPSIDRALSSLALGETCTVGNILCKGGKVWQFTPAPARRVN